MLIILTVKEKMLKNQLQAVFSDFKIDGIKIGMVYNSQIIKVIHNQLKKLKIPIIVDPVIKSTTGGTLLEKSAIKDFQKYIIPIATAITPNEYEAKILSNTKTKISNKKIAQRIQKLGSKNVIITGIKSKNNEIKDFVLEKNKNYFISDKKISKINHGSGDIYSVSLLYSLVKGNNLKKSLEFAKQTTFDAVKNAKKRGKGIAITDIQNQDSINEKLTNAINKFTEIKDIYKSIPECQTNFVYSKEKIKNTNNILGVSGRIVKAGKKVLVAGNLEYGGSKHVATALLIMIIWGSFSEFLVDLNGNGKLWLFIENWYNPVFITINDNGLTIIPQLIWFVAPILYYFTVLKCLSKKI